MMEKVKMKGLFHGLAKEWKKQKQYQDKQTNIDEYNGSNTHHLWEMQIDQCSWRE